MEGLFSDAGFSVVLDLAKGAGLGLAAAALLLFIWSKCGLLVRHTETRRVLVTLYHVYIPLVFAGVGAVWFTCTNLQQRVATAFEALRPQVTAVSVQATEQIWTAVRDRAPEVGGEISVKDGVVAVVREYVHQKFTEGMAQRPEMPDLVSDFVSRTGEGLCAAVVALFEDRFTAGAAGQPTVTPAQLRAIWDRDIMPYMRQGMFTDFVALWLNKSLLMVETKAKTIGLFLLLPVLVETFFAMLYNRRLRRREAAVTAAT